MNQIRPITLLDLDDTIFQTAKHLSQSELKHMATLDKNGCPLSFMTDKQLQFWKWLNATTTVIPVTARNRAGLKRVQFSFDSFAICQHGSTILLPSGETDTHWASSISQKLALLQDDFSKITEILERDSLAIEGVRYWIETDEALTGQVYFVVKQSKDNPVYFEKIKQAYVHTNLFKDFYIHVNSTTMAILPKFISKKSAVQYLIEKRFTEEQQQTVLLGYGDSLSDLGFLQECDFLGFPKRSQNSQFVSEYLPQKSEQGQWFEVR